MRMCAGGEKGGWWAGWRAGWRADWLAGWRLGWSERTRFSHARRPALDRGARRKSAGNYPAAAPLSAPNARATWAAAYAGTQVFYRGRLQVSGSLNIPTAWNRWAEGSGMRIWPNGWAGRRNMALRVGNAFPGRGPNSVTNSAAASKPCHRCAPVAIGNRRRRVVPATLQTGSTEEGQDPGRGSTASCRFSGDGDNRKPRNWRMEPIATVWNEG